MNPNEVALDSATLADIETMCKDEAIFKLAGKFFLSLVLAEPFTYSIPAMKSVSDEDERKIIERFWMPFCRDAYWMNQKVGLVGYYFEENDQNPENPIPRVVSLDKGFISVGVNKKHRNYYRFFWTHDSTQPEEQVPCYWHVSENAPSSNGTINSVLASILEEYRCILKMRVAQNIVNTQLPRPVHLMEDVPIPGKQGGDDLVTYRANYSDAAGVVKDRIERQKEAEYRYKTQELRKALDRMNQANLASNQTPSLLWTESSAAVLDEIDPGFSNRVILLNPGKRYVQPARPAMVGDYYKALQQFNMLAAATMDFAYELITPTGSSRTQNIDGGNEFEKARTRDTKGFFVNLVQPALVRAYRPKFVEQMDKFREQRIADEGLDADEVNVLLPELDVVVHFTPSDLNSYDQYKIMWMDGIMSKDTFAEHAYKNANLPMDQVRVTEWPDKYPRELLVKPEKKEQGVKRERPPPTEKKAEKKKPKKE